MRYEYRTITTEIETLQREASKTGRHIETVYLKEGEMDEFALECQAANIEGDPRKVPAHDNFWWKGTKVQRDLKS